MVKDISSKSKGVKKAVALRYKLDDSAPVVVAKGKGIIAEKIIERAKDEKLYVHQDEELVNSLMNLQLNEEIPEELYEVLAEIILYVYSLDSQRSQEND